MARFAPIALMLAVMLSCLAFATPDAKADGKVFLSIATDTGSGSTMPRQRAIIAYKDGEQRLAIDTAFTGAGEEFAWLVPLPSEPEILPATKGMFDTAAMVTAPRVSGRGATVLLPALILGGAIFGMALNIRRSETLLLILLVLFLVALLLPALSMVRSLPGSFAVDLRSEQQVGVYDTAVLTADDSSELLAWLNEQGYAAPDGAQAVMQDYLDRGWVFAAAKLRDDSDARGDRRAHPLQFRFSTEQPVYPMSLTAVDNETIELELFIFAEGTASTDRLKRVTSFGAERDNRDADDHAARGLLRKKPAIVAHPGLIDIVDGLPWVTRMRGVLTPAQQRKDLEIKLGKATTKNPLRRTPDAHLSNAIAVGIWVATGFSILWLLMAGLSRESSERPLLPRSASRLPWLVTILVTGLLTAGGVYFGTPIYRGELSRGIAVYMLERNLEEAALLVEGQAIEQFASTTEELDAIRVSVFEKLHIDPPIGDSPLHYRIEFNDDETEARFIWHDLIGGEHRVVIPLAGDAGDEPTP
ncbi:MAG: DUF2330 domain-containing protein [Phycisphaerales bacterium JB065]